MLQGVAKEGRETSTLLESLHCRSQSNPGGEGPVSSFRLHRSWKEVFRTARLHQRYRKQVRSWTCRLLLE